MNNIIVSFCIATFQRYEVLAELIDDILSVYSDKFEVVICDDRSLDDSIAKLKEINDPRLKIYVNDKNVGSLQNIYKTLEYGQGRYLFYLNDRDNIDKLKIDELLRILEIFDEENVAFAKCVFGYPNTEKYHIFEKGRDSLVSLACRMDHPTGIIFKRDNWKRIRNRRFLFQKEKYGDYPMNQICAILGRNYKGAFIFGNICDVYHHRIDFKNTKSGFYKGRKDKRLFYTPEVIFREIVIGQKMLKNIGVNQEIRREILISRYTEYLSWCVTKYRDIVIDPVYTSHYNVSLPQDFIHVFIMSIWNGIKLWTRTRSLCSNTDKVTLKLINEVTRKEYVQFLKDIYKDELQKRDVKVADAKTLIYKQEEVLKVYERWIKVLQNNNTISKCLLKNKCYEVGIYGMGRIGKHLFDELKDSEIYVKYVIDQNICKYTQFYKEVPCYSIDSELPKSDLIIVTIPSEATEIMNKLRKRTNCQLRSINDILFASHY